MPHSRPPDEPLIVKSSWSETFLTSIGLAATDAAGCDAAAAAELVLGEAAPLVHAARRHAATVSPAAARRPDVIGVAPLPGRVGWDASPLRLLRRSQGRNMRAREDRCQSDWCTAVDAGGCAIHGCPTTSDRPATRANTEAMLLSDASCRSW